MIYTVDIFILLVIYMLVAWKTHDSTVCMVWVCYYSLTRIWFVQWALVVRVHHDVTVLTLLSHVGPRVATAPVAIAIRATKLTPYSLLALIWGFLLL